MCCVCVYNFFFVNRHGSRNRCIDCLALFLSYWLDFLIMSRYLTFITYFLFKWTHFVIKIVYIFVLYVYLVWICLKIAVGFVLVNDISVCGYYIYVQKWRQNYSIPIWVCVCVFVWYKKCFEYENQPFWACQIYFHLNLIY